MTTSWNFQGASFDRSAIGPNSHVDNRGSTGDIHDLAELLARLRQQLVDAPDTPEQRAAIFELDGLVGELADSERDPEAVSSRWQRLRARVATVLPAAAGIAQIASLVNDVVGV